jgi:hypothetical protein
MTLFAATFAASHIHTIWELFMTTSQTLRIAAFAINFEDVSMFFRSCAMAITTQRFTQSKWIAYDDSYILDTVYLVMFWKEAPGYVSVETGDPKQVAKETDKLHATLVRNWITKLTTYGPKVAQDYVQKIEKLRSNAISAVNGIFRCARIANNQVCGTVTQSMRNLAMIKLTAAIGVAVISGGAGLAFAGGATAGSSLTLGGLTMTIGTGGTGIAAAGIGNAVSLSLVKNWHAGASAKVVAVDTGAKTASGVTKRAAIVGNATIKQLALNTVENSERIIESTNKEIARKSRMIANAARKQRTAKRVGRLANAVKRQKDILNTSTQTAAKAGVVSSIAKGVGYSLPVVFAGWDIINAIGTYNEAVAALK